VYAYHHSVPVVADVSRCSDVTISVQLFAWAHEEPGKSTTSVELVFERGPGGPVSREGYQLEPSGYRALLGMLTDGRIADAMRAEFDRAVKEYRRDNFKTGEPVPDWVEGYAVSRLWTGVSVVILPC
jgi:hypothetical protein